ncbi:MAG TPA: MFS transporter [Candidatus Limnocylindria bacterium]|nr:MFS transporter [Candidatus Limnocylindria bacterium]
MLATYRRLLGGNPALTRLLAGEFVSGIGDWLYLVALLIVVYAESESALLLGIIGAARILPYVLLSVPAGIVVDRFERRLVLLVTDVGRGLLMLVLAGLVVVDGPIWMIVAASIAAACLSTFFGPAIAALLPELVDESDLAPANGAWATLDSLGYIIGPAVAGFLIAAGGLALAFLLNAVSFAVVAVVLWRLPARSSAAGAAPVEPTPDAASPAGWGQLARPLVGPLVLDAAGSLVLGGLGVLTVVLAVDVLGAGEAATGYLNAATGVGGVVAGIAGGALVARGLGLPLVVGGAVAALGVAWVGFAGSLLTAMLALGIGVAGILLLDVANTTLVQRTVPDAIRGRALGVVQTSSAIFYSAGSLLLPVLATGIGVAPTMVGSAIVLALGTGAALVLSARGMEPSALDPERAAVIRLPIFAGLPPGRLEAVARAMEPLDAPAGQVVVREGAAADRFYVIADGTYAVTQRRAGTERELRRLGPGDVFGEIGLIERSPRTATVTAVSGGRLLALDGAAFLELVGSGPGLGTRLLDLYRGAIGR